MNRQQYKRLLKTYNISIQQENAYDITSDRVIPENIFKYVTGRDLVINDINYNTDSIGIRNGSNELTYIYNKNNKLVFNSKPFKGFFEIDKEACINLIGEYFDKDLYPILDYAIEGTLSNNNDCIFNYLGHSTDSFYFYVKDGIIYEMQGVVCSLDGVIKNTNCPLNEHTRVYGIFNTLPINILVLGNVALEELTAKDNLYELSYNPSQLQYSVSKIRERYIDELTESFREAEYLLNVKCNCFCEILGEGAILIDGLAYKTGSVLHLDKHKNYNIKKNVDSIIDYDKDYSQLITKQSLSYLQDQFKDEIISTFEYNTTPTLIQLDASLGLRLLYTDNMNKIVGIDEVYFFAQ